jgi:hypothetical protein
MRKLRLNAEELKVESFDTDNVREARGTVVANEQYTYFCASAPECRTYGYASCMATRCYDECSTHVESCNNPSMCCP